MIECIFGSIVGTLLGLTGVFYISRYQLKKDFDDDLKQLKKLMDQLAVFNVVIKDEE